MPVMSRAGTLAWIQGQQALVCSEGCWEAALHHDGLVPVVVEGKRFSAQAASRRLGVCVWCGLVMRGEDPGVEPAGAGEGGGR
jgi:hypothetical protein